MKVAIVLPGWSVFSRVGDHAGAGQLHHRVRDHFRVDAEVAAILQPAARDFRHRADADLQRRAVVDQIRHVFPGLPLRVVRGACRHLGDGTVDFDEVVDVGDVDHAVSVEPGHGGVDFRDHRAADLGGAQRVVDRDAQAAVTVFVGWRDAHHRDVGRDVRPDDRRHLAEEAGHEIRPAFVHRDAGARGAKERDVADAVCDFAAQVRGAAEDEDRRGPHALQLVCTVRERFEQRAGLAARVCHHDHVARSDRLHGFGGSDPASFCVVHRRLHSAGEGGEG